MLAAENFADFSVAPWQWAAFLALVSVLLLVDLLVLHRKPHVIPIKEAAIETGVWVGIGLAFGLAVLVWHGGQAAGEYWTGYLLELSLSVDNVFVWAVILTFFAVPSKYQFRVLFWGVFGALVDDDFHDDPSATSQAPGWFAVSPTTASAPTPSADGCRGLP